MAFSFNGGKDSTVLLHLLRAAVARRAQRQDSNGLSWEEKPQGRCDEHSNFAHKHCDEFLGGIRTFFFDSRTDFPEIVDFVHQTDEQYCLGMETLHGDFKAGVADFINRTSIKAIILGTRRNDPNARGQEVFCPSSKGWAPFMRVNPVLDWTYHDVWAFLRLSCVPYCILYDRGYTSLGSVENTFPNESLLREDGTYAPAHALPDARLERAGRISRGDVIERRPSAVRNGGTVGLLLIGDEILSAKVNDVNMSFLCSELRASGWLVERAVFVRDRVDAIASEVRVMSDKHDVVITAGGIGPTPDDVTMKGVADAFGRTLSRNVELEEKLRDHFGPNLTSAHLKMAELPAGGEVSLIFYDLPDGVPSPFPLVRFRNVYVLPGVPALLRKKWNAVKEELARSIESKDALRPFRSLVLRLRLGSSDEVHVACAMEQAATKWGRSVSFGSYPLSDQSDGCGIALSLESKDESMVALARKDLLAFLPPGVVASEHPDSDRAINSPVEAPTVGM